MTREKRAEKNVVCERKTARQRDILANLPRIAIICDGVRQRQPAGTPALTGALGSPSATEGGTTQRVDRVTRRSYHSLQASVHRANTSLR